MSHIKIIVGSTRETRFGLQIAQWFMDSAAQQANSTFELVDLKEVALPFLNEPKPPLAGDYQHNSTKTWSKIISEADGFVFITPEYNHSVPASLKNALDTAAVEWAYKPAAFIGYGVAGGIRAIEHLRQIASQLRMYGIHDEVNVHNYWAHLDKSGQFTAGENHTKDVERVRDSIIFWTEKLTPIRQELMAKK